MGGAITTDAARNTPLLLLRLSLLFGMLIVRAVASAPASPPEVSVCVRDGCNCTSVGPQWLKATCVFDSKQTVELGAGSLPPTTLELAVSGAGELRLLAGAFSRLGALQRVRVEGVGSVAVRRHAFLNVTAARTVLEVADCGRAVLERHAFRSARGPLTASVVRCAHVVVQGAAFSWVVAVTLRDVPRLELAPQAFAFEAPSSGRHGPAAAVLLQNVVLAELPRDAFPSSAAEVRFVDAEVRTVQAGAFCANTLFSVIFQNSSLHRVEAGAFSDRTLIKYLELSGVRIRVLAARALQAAVDNLTVQHSRVSEVSEGAVNITVAKASFVGNAFERLATRGLVLKSWSLVRLDNNTFGALAADALEAPPGVGAREFSFAGNELERPSAGALRFLGDALEGPVRAHLADNRFAQLCHCDLAAWVREVAGGVRGAEALFNGSACTVDAVLARCFDVPQGFLAMRDYAELVCGAADVIVCEETKGESAVSVVRTADEAEDTDRDRKVLGLIFLVVVCATAVILVITGVLWLRRHGYCVRARLLLLPTATSCLTMCSALFRGAGAGAGGLVTARSISRLSMHEYTELQGQQKRHRGLLEDDASEAGEADLEEVPCEDKWTQTLPEELTQELLQSLREKLDDPDNYGEARDMIEHLYDLIKVEESCNNNNAPSASRAADEDDDDDLYDVIQAPRRKARRAATCSVGTRAPSPDKLLPYAQARLARRPAVLCEYVEPRDREQHLYTELPGGGGVPPPSEAADSGANKSPTRPLSFLRALGESILPGRKAPQLCDYTEPTDAAVHVYTEVPASGTLRCSSKMANRPLPTKPDQDPGEGTSASSN